MCDEKQREGIMTISRTANSSGSLDKDSRLLVDHMKIGAGTAQICMKSQREQNTAISHAGVLHHLEGNSLHWLF